MARRAEPGPPARPSAGSRPTPQPPALFSAVEADATAHAASPTAEADIPGPTILRQRFVALDSVLLATARAAGQVQAATATPPTLSLNLFADTVFPATVTRVEATRSGGYALAGHLDSHPLSTFTLVVNGDTVAGTVLTPEDRYELASPPDTPGVTAIRQVDPTSLPGGCDTDASSPLPASASASSTAEPEEAGGAASDDPTVIDVAVFYTPAARKSWGGTALAETTIDLWVAEDQPGVCGQRCQPAPPAGTSAGDRLHRSGVGDRNGFESGSRTTLMVI